MSCTDVLPFVRGIDFTKYNFSDQDESPLQLLSVMERLRWIKINATGLSHLPLQLASLSKLAIN
jgi:hypothetical protein